MSSPTQFIALLTAARARRREQWLSPAELKELRGSRLRRLARAAAKTAHYGRLFRDAGLDPEELADERELVRLPVLEKATLQAEENGMLAEPAERLFSVMTSGSTGQPVRVFRSTRDQAQVSALWARVHEVRRWQLRQTASDTLCLLVVRSPTWRPEAAGEIARQLSEKFGPGLRFEVVPVEDITLAPTGKFQTVVPLADSPASATS